MHFDFANQEANCLTIQSTNTIYIIWFSYPDRRLYVKETVSNIL